jgi:hypothetical protein
MPTSGGQERDERDEHARSGTADETEGRDEEPRADRRSEPGVEPKPELVRDPAEETAGRGRMQVIAASVTLGGAVALLGVLGANQGGGRFLQAIALGLLLVQLFRGRPWARWVLVAFAGWMAVSYARYGADDLGSSASLVSLGLALAFALSAGVLALSKPVSTFLAAQRVRHR